MLAGASRALYASGECEVDLDQRELRLLGVPAPIGGRAFEILEVLVRSAGALVTKDELMERIWPGAIVLENTLQVHIVSLRRALGPYRALVRTEAGRGYRLLGEWTLRDVPLASRPRLNVSPTTERKGATNLPGFITPLIGRSAATELLRDLVSAYRVVTLTGPGGIGKTTLALHVARVLSPAFADGAWLVELASLSDSDLVASTVAGALQLNIGVGEISAVAIACAINDRHLLLIIDNCEHVINATANLAELLVQSCPRVTILMTSREVMRIDGEYVYRVPPLEVPAQDELPDVRDHSAIELFIARTQSLDSDFSPGADSLPAIAAICRHLDGIPLAIELAAARAATLGLGQVAAGLGDRFRLLTSGRRTALPRHQTLRATLDWSYALLPEAEQRLLCRTAVFPAGFTLDAAVSVMEGVAAGRAVVTEGIANLVHKSLVMPERSEPVGRWRLLETTRVYAREKLAESGDAALVARRHAEFYLALFAPFSDEERLQDALADLSRYRREIDNLRAALNWAFSAAGDATLGIELAAAAADFWGAMSLLGEACEWANKALAPTGEPLIARHEMVLQCSLGVALIYTRGMIAPARAALMRARALARELRDFDYLQRAFHDLWLFSARGAASNDALVLAREYEALSRGRDHQSRAVADWIVGVPQTYLALHVEASERLQRAIDQYPVERRGRDLIRFGSDLRASAASHLTVNLLSRGLLDTASQTATGAIEEARATNQPVILCIALAWAAGFVFLSLGELASAERYGGELIDHAYKHGLRPFHAAGLCVRGSLAAKHGNPESGLDPLHRGLAEMQETSYLLFYPFFRAELAMALSAMGRVDDGLVEIDDAMHVAEETDYRWFVPELLRVKGEVLLQQTLDNRAPAETCFGVAAELASAQGALFWELRAALSAARLRLTQKDRAGAVQLLRPVYDQFTEGFETSDLRAAKALLLELSS